MGTLVGMLTDSYLTPHASDEEILPDGAIAENQFGLGFRFQLEMQPEQFDKTKAALKELVSLRNDLVHHFIDQFDLWSVQGCCAADEFLATSYQTIHQHHLTLREWAKTMAESRLAIASWLGGPDAKAFFDAMTVGDSTVALGGDIFRRSQ
jgi:hypothetical protein